jgi:hypothetical protein
LTAHQVHDLVMKAMQAVATQEIIAANVSRPPFVLTVIAGRRKETFTWDPDRLAGSPPAPGGLAASCPKRVLAHLANQVGVLRPEKLGLEAENVPAKGVAVAQPPGIPGGTESRDTRIPESRISVRGLVESNRTRESRSLNARGPDYLLSNETCRYLSPDRPEPWVRGHASRTVPRQEHGDARAPALGCRPPAHSATAQLDT